MSAAKPHRSRADIEADVCDPPLGMMAWLSVATEHGYRCPYCGRFCKQSAFSAAPTVTRMAGAIVHHGPACKRCRGIDSPQGSTT